MGLVRRGNSARKAKGFTIWVEGYFYNIWMSHFLWVEEGGSNGGHGELGLKSANHFVEDDSADQGFVSLKIENPIG
jgi:hypothetical protein